MNDVILGSDELRMMGFEKKQSWDSSLEEGSRFLVSPRRHQLGSTKCAARFLNKLCLSLLPKKKKKKNLKLKNVYKSFVPEPISCFSDFYMRIWTFVNVFRICMNISISHTHTWLCNTQADSVVQVRTVLLTSDVGSSTQGERHNSYYAIPMPTHGSSCGVYDLCL